MCVNKCIEISVIICVDMTLNANEGMAHTPVCLVACMTRLSLDMCVDIYFNIYLEI